MHVKSNLKLTHQEMGGRKKERNDCVSIFFGDVEFITRKNS